MKKNNSRRQFIKLSAAGSAGLLTMGGTACQWVGKKEAENNDKKKWNLLFIWTDQQRYDTMEVYGNQKIKTPNLNKLANQSVVFKTAYVSQPVSTPSRSTIMTGLYPHTNGCTANNIPLKKETPCLPELINDPEYKTAYMGKWHLGDELYAQHGFNEWVSISDGYNNYFSEGKDRMKKSTYHHWLIDKGYEPDIKDDPYGERFSRGAAARMPIEHSKPMFLKEQALRFLEENKDHPFILYVNYLEPHNPYFGSLDELHDPDEATVPENFNDLIDETENLRLQIKHYRNKDEHSKDEETLRKLIAKYWGLVSLVDKSVGSILDKLDELGLAENTIVVYTSDHGEMLGSHKMTGKGVPFEEATRVPFLMRLPQLGFKQRIIEEQVSQIDLVPTLVSLMGYPIDESLQGKSLMPLITRDKRGSDYIFYEWNSSLSHKKASEELIEKYGNKEEIEEKLNGSSRTVVSPERWKLVLTEHGINMLYDLNSDPYETTNVYYTGKHDEKIKLLTQKIKDWQQQTGDTLKLSI